MIRSALKKITNVVAGITVITGHTNAQTLDDMIAETKEICSIIPCSQEIERRLNELTPDERCHFHMTNKSFKQMEADQKTDAFRLSLVGLDFSRQETDLQSDFEYRLESLSEYERNLFEIRLNTFKRLTVEQKERFFNHVFLNSNDPLLRTTDPTDYTNK
jgi:plasmid maintenance system killer protein